MKIVYHVKDTLYYHAMSYHVQCPRSLSGCCVSPQCLAALVSANQRAGLMVEWDPAPCHAVSQKGLPTWPL
jgi:hypothetical protein